MEKLDKILDKALAKKGLLKQARGAEICFYSESWNRIPFSPISFSKGILKVSVESSVAASELSMKEEELINFINEKAGYKAVKKLRIVNIS